MEISEEDVKRADGVFHQPPTFPNCAQSVAILTGHPEQATDLAVCGGGRAPGGLCGALHAALLFTPAEKRDELIDAFRETVGATTCREIKGTTRTPCSVCVAAGAKLTGVGAR